MNSQLVPITIQVEYECALLAMQIADRQRELTRLQRELAPLETAFGLFEQRVASQSASITAERNRLRHRCRQIEDYTTRLHARLIADPDGHFSIIFSPDELRAPGDIFGITVPDAWFGEELHATTSGAWEWAENPDAFARQKQIPPDDAIELRTLYRQLAKTYHPDLATDTEDLAFRQEMMLRINHAWHDRDLDALRKVQRGSVEILNAGTNRSRFWHLQRLQRDLAQMVQRCAQAQTRLTALRRSKTRALWHDAALANAAIARHVRKLEAEIEQLRLREQAVVEEFRQAFGHYASRS